MAINLIDADSLRHAMYVKAFMEDNNMQKWDSGCWIRYKMFEKCIEKAPRIQCKYCINWQTDWTPICADFTPEDHFCAMIDLVTEGDFCCGFFERKQDNG